MPLCVYLCYTPGCQVKVERWMPTAAEGAAEKIPCPRCGVTLTCAWTGSQVKTPALRDAGALGAPGAGGSGEPRPGS